MKLRHLTTPALALILMSACSDDGTGVDPDDLAGTWTATSIVFTSVADPTVSVDLVAEEQAGLTFTFGDDDTYTLVFTFPGEEIENETGTYVVSGSTLTLSPSDQEESDNFAIVRDGNSLTLTANEEDFAFDDEADEEPATLVVMLTR